METPPQAPTEPPTETLTGSAAGTAEAQQAREREAQMVTALRFSRDPRVRTHRSTKDFVCYCPGRLNDESIFYPLPGEIECGHDDCAEVIEPGTHYARDRNRDWHGLPVCLACAAALWAPPLCEVDDLVAQQHAAQRAFLDAMFKDVSAT